MERIVIIGGGIAGLSCANSLVDHGVMPLLFENKQIGAPKMCGEFIAASAIPYLHNWQIATMYPIKKVTFFAHKNKTNLEFPQTAAAMARSEAELLLAARLRSLGMLIYENTLIKKIIPKTNENPYIFYLESGEEIHAQSLIAATGKFTASSTSNTNFPYYGFKIHFNEVFAPQTLQMYSLPGAYLGIVPISNEVSNCACLVKKNLIEQFGSCKTYLRYLLSHHEFLGKIFAKIDLNEITWLETKAPEFTYKKNPNWPQALWIGDAIATLHPALGLGFAHAISSGVQAADYYLKNNIQQYRKKSYRKIKSKIRLGKLIHNILLKPKLASLLIRILPGKKIIFHHILKNLNI